MYTLDFETIRQVMQAHQKTGSLHAEMSNGTPNLREPCKIEINIMTGTIVSCTIISNSGRYLTGEKAVQELSRLGQLSWTFRPQQEAVKRPASPVLAPGEPLFFPQRIAYLEQWQMNSLSRLQRTVFALTDGTKNAAKIADILSISSDQVDKALNDLQAMGVITMRQQNGKKYR